METKLLRQKLMNDFGKILEDDSKLELLENVFDAIISDNKASSIPQSHYLKVEEARHHYLSGIRSGITWEDFEKELSAKYGF